VGPQKSPRAFRIRVGRADSDLAVALLHEAGTLGLEELPSGDKETVFTAYFQDSPGIEDALAIALGGLGHAEALAVPEVDWVARVREGFQPIACGSFWIVPSWQSRAPSPPGSLLLRVDPGRAFGTGTHETTRLCLRAIEALSPPPPGAFRLLDLGTGSGILAVAAALLGWRSVVALDVDPEAIESARNHARLNEVTLSLVLGDLGDAIAKGSFDVVVANITAPLLVSHAASVASAAKKGATLVLSGLLTSDLPEVETAYAAFGAQSAETDGEWASVMVRVGA